MSASDNTIRLITVLFLLAGILLLRKPVFGQELSTAPTRVPVIVQGVQAGKAAGVIAPRALSRP